MATFRPPTDNFVFPTPTTRDMVLGVFSREERRQRALAKFYPSSPRGRNVFWMNDGTFIETDPVDPADVRKVFYGGHDNVLTDEEQSALTAAGYGAYIS